MRSEIIRAFTKRGFSNAAKRVTDAEFLIVLGDGYIPELKRRTYHCAELIIRGSEQIKKEESTTSIKKKIILSGYKSFLQKDKKPEAETMKELITNHWLERGFDDYKTLFDIILEERSETTFENLFNSAKIIEERKENEEPTIMIISSLEHVKRATKIAELYFPKGYEIIGAAIHKERGKHRLKEIILRTGLSIDYTTRFWLRKEGLERKLEEYYNKEFYPRNPRPTLSFLKIVSYLSTKRYQQK